MFVMETISTNFAIFYTVGAIILMVAGFWQVHQANRDFNELIDNASDRPNDDLD